MFKASYIISWYRSSLFHVMDNVSISAIDSLLLAQVFNVYDSPIHHMN